MTEQRLSSIERVDLRTEWPDETADFTPWLAENISALGNALGMALEVEEREAPVGRYSLDIRATDVNRDRPVIIENQLDASDHTHLGQLLTYAAGYDAKVVVWLTREFRDEHRKALDWLNNQTGEDIQFFGVVVELLKIDRSRPAPNFKLIAYPNDWRKERVSRPVSKRGERYRQFFQKLIDTLREERFTGPRKTQPQHWYNFPTGYGRRVVYEASFTRDKGARTELYIDTGDGENNLRVFSNLEEHKTEIEAEFDQPLEWEPLETKRACRIAAYMPGHINDDEEILAEIRKWMVANLLRFKKVFDPHLKRELAKH